MSEIETLENRFEEKTAELAVGTEQAKTRTEKTWQDWMETVKRHPAKAIGITLAAGVTVGSLITAASRRRRYSTADQIKDLAANGTDAWDRVKSGFEDAIGSLKEAMEDAVGKFK